MAIIKVDDPVRLGRLVLALRAAKNAENNDTGSETANQAYNTLTDSNATPEAKKDELAKWGIQQKERYARKCWEDELEDITGSELEIVFDEHDPQKTTMVIPTNEDLIKLWDLRENECPSEDDLAELGRYMLKKCR